MMEPDNADHYAARAARALELAEMATDPAIARLHRHMASSYLELAELMTRPEPGLGLVNK